MHFVVVCVDALRADHLGCYAGTDRGTPHIDRLAADGVQFANAISQASWTHPSMASMMTGLYPSQHVMTGARKERDASTKLIALNAALPTLAGCLREAGYTTAAFVAGNAYLKPEFGITRGFDHLDWRTTIDGSAVVDGFAHWLETTEERRSFAYLHLMDAHSPLPQELYASRPMVDRGVDVAGSDAGLDTLLGYYAAGVRRADAHVGRVLALLERRGRLGDTWVILTADHGEELNEHGVMLSHGQSLYRQLVWVPLVVRLPGRQGAGRAPAQPVAHIDLLPTILQVAAAPVHDVPGRSLLPLLLGPDGHAPTNGHGPAPGTGDPAAFSELLKRVRYSRSVTTTEYQFIETFHVSKMPPAMVADLHPGVAVEVKGQPVGGCDFLPTKVTIGVPGDDKLLGSVEAIDVSAATVTILGCTVEIDAGTQMVGLDKAPFSLAEVSVGDRLNIALDPPPGIRGVPEDAGAGRRAREVMWRKAGGESKLEGPVEAVEERGDGTVTVRVLGRAVHVDPGRVRLVHRDPAARRWRREDVLAMVAAGNYLGREQELYRFSVDPEEMTNLVDEEPEVARALEERLATWARSIAGTQAPGELVELDPETEEQLRKLGYLA